MPPRAIARASRRPSPERVRGRPGPARRAAAGTPAPSTAGTSARPEAAVRRRRTRGRASAPPRRARRASIGSSPASTTSAAAGARGRPRDPAHLVAPVRPRLVERLQHLPERGLPVPRLVGEVGAGEERLAVGVSTHRHRPAALAGHRLRRLHVDGVDVGPLLAVDLDVDEVLVHVRRGRLVLERLVRHHVAPVAGGVPDADSSTGTSRRRASANASGPTPTSRPGCPRAGGGRGWWPWPAVRHPSPLRSPEPNKVPPPLQDSPVSRLRPPSRESTNLTHREGHRQRPKEGLS